MPLIPEVVINRATKGRRLAGFRPVDSRDIRNAANTFSFDPTVRAAYEKICKGVFGDDGIVIYKKDFYLPEWQQTLFNAQWIPFAKQVIREFICYGICICTIGREHVPRVVPIQMVRISISHLITGERIYHLEDSAQAIQAGTRLLTTGNERYIVFEKYPPNVNSQITSPLRSLLKNQAFAELMRQLTIIAQNRAALPSIVTVSAGTTLAQEQVSRDTMFYGQANLNNQQQAQISNNRAMFVAAANERLGRLQNQALVSQSSQISNHALVDMMDGSVVNPIPIAGESSTHQQITVPDGRTVARVPLSQSPPFFMAFLEHVDNLISRALGVPAAVWNPQKYASLASDIVEQTMEDTLDDHRDDITEVVRYMVELIFGLKNRKHALDQFDFTKTPTENFEAHQIQVAIDGNLSLAQMNRILSSNVLSQEEYRALIYDRYKLDRRMRKRKFSQTSQHPSEDRPGASSTSNKEAVPSKHSGRVSPPRDPEADSDQPGA